MAQQQQTKPHAREHKSNSHEQVVPPAHVVIDPPFPAITNSQPQPTNTQAQTPEKPLPRFLRPEWVIVYITAVYVFFTGLTLLAIRRQANTMDSQAKDALTSAQNTLNEIKRQADLMDAQLKAMDNSRIQVNRQIEILESSVVAAQTGASAAKLSADVAARGSVPTLVIEKFEWFGPKGADLADTFRYPDVKVVIKNYGHTPAFLRSWNIIFTCEELPPVPDYWHQPGQSGVKPRSAGIVLEKDVVEPNQSYTLPQLMTWHRTEISLEDVQAIIHRKKNLWVYGFICYYDLFGSPLRRMKFCELALNFSAGWIGWKGGFAPDAYRGTEDYIFSQLTASEEIERQTISGEGTEDEQHE